MRGNRGQQLLLVDEAIFAAMKKLLFLGACLVALASQPVKAQTSKPSVIVVRVNDVNAGGKMVIVREGGKTEELEFAGGYSLKQLSSSGLLMQQVFSKLYEEGYSLKSTFGGSSGFGSTLLFVKEK